MSSNIVYINQEEILKEKIGNIKFFKTLDLSYPLNDYHIQKILCAKVDVFIGDAELLQTASAMSNDGVYLSGYKLRIELIINYFVKYLDDMSIKVIRNRSIKLINIVMPKEVEFMNIEEAFIKKRIKINSYVEGIYCDKFEENFDLNLSILVNCIFV